MIDRLLSGNAVTLMRIALVVSMLAILTPASALPIAGPEVGVCWQDAAARGNQDCVDICYGGGVYLAVWHDRRSTSDFDVYGIILNSDGSSAGGESFLISGAGDGTGAADDQVYPGVGYNGTNFLVAWSDSRSGNASIYAARVTPTGEVLDPEGRELSNPHSRTQSMPQVASCGTTWEVVWREANATGGQDIYAAVVSAAGVASARTAISNRLDGEDWPDIAWNGSNYLVVWEDSRNSGTTGTDIYGYRLTSAGARTGSEFVVSTAAGSTTNGYSGDQMVPSVTAGSSGTWLVVWQDARGAADNIYGARVASGGTVTDLGGKSICTSAGNQQQPQVGWDGTNYIVVWRDEGSDPSRRISGIRLNANAAAVGTTLWFSPGAAGPYGPAVASQAGSSLVGWYSLDVTNSDVGGVRVSSSGVIGAYSTWSFGVQDQPQYRVAFDGTNYVAVWSDRRDGFYCVYAARIAPDGTVLDPAGVTVSTIVNGDQTEPAIAWNGTHYLVVWTEQADIRGMRLTPSLSRVDASGLSICNYELSQKSPAVAWNGTNFLVVWEDYRTATSPDYYGDIRGARVSSTGTITQVVAYISGAEGYQMLPSVASCGTGFLVAWEDYRTGSSEVYCSRVTNTGSVQDISGVKVPAVSYNNFRPCVTSNGSHYLVVWSDQRDVPAGSNVYGVRMSTGAARLDASDILIGGGPGEQVAPFAAWDGQKYLVAWQDYTDSIASDADIYLNAVGSDGAVLSPTARLVSGAEEPELNPAAVANGAGAGLALYSKLKFETHRLASRILVEPPPVPVVTDDGVYSTSSTSLHAVWTVAPRESEVAEYRYAIGTQPGYADVVDWTSAGLMTEVTHGGLSLAGGTSYYFAVQSRGTSGMWSDSGVSDGILVDGSKPTIPVVVDDGSYTTTGSLHASWSASDPETGVQEYRYAIGTTSGGTDIVDWTSAGTDLQITRSDLSLTDGAMYYFSVQARNGVGLWSDPGNSDGIEADASAPTTPAVTDDGEFTSSASSLHAAWTSEDPHTGIEEYRYAIGTTAGGNDIVDWTSAGTSAEVNVTALSLTDGTKYYFTVEARNGAGAWSERGSSDGITADSTAPSVPVTTDDGAWTLPDRIRASWSSEDDASGIKEYMYAVGTTAGGTELIGWTSAGTSTEATVTGLSLSEGTPYYISVKAQNGAGLWSDFGASDGISVSTDAGTILQAKGLSNENIGLRLSGQLVSAGTSSLPVLPGETCFYIEQPDRISAIKVVSEQIVPTGATVDLAGVIELVGGERRITASVINVTATGGTAPGALNMMDRAVGGTALNGYTPGVSETGPHNLGLLIKTWGKVAYVGGEGENYFYLNGGSFLRDGSGHVGVKVYCGALAKPAMNSSVVVTGISSCEPLESATIRRVLAVQLDEYPQ